MVELLSELRLMFEEARSGLRVNFAGLVEFVWHLAVCCVEVMVLDRVKRQVCLFDDSTRNGYELIRVEDDEGCLCLN
jgi:hypothetical protein